ncbi:hypothetical protein FGB62_100g010 [Gracilaria domingensis]|nr:hypothetical protein FGB62_100g010 [Gracilaria domingensis]
MELHSPRSSNDNAVGDNRVSIEEVHCRRGWCDHIRLLETRDPQFFTSAEARLSDINTCAGSGRSVYDGIGASVDNFMGLQNVFKFYYKSRERLSAVESTAFRQRTVTVSQLLPWAVSCSFISKEDCWNEYVLYQCVTSIKLLVPFTSYFRGCCSPGTLRNKTMSLISVCRTGIHRVANDKTAAKLKVAALFLRSIANASRRNHRILSQSKKSRRANKARITLIPARTSLRCIKNALRRVDLLMRRYHQLAEEKEFRANVNEEDINRFPTEWTMNFIGLLIMVSGGQRPQVFSHVQVPTEQELIMCEETATFEVFTIGHIRVANTVSEVSHLHRNVNDPKIIQL